MLEDLTGRFAEWGAYHLKAMEDYFDIVNKQGGIDGVPVKVLWADVKWDAALSVSAYKRFKREGVVTMGALATPPATAIKTMAIEDMMPCIVQSIGMDLYFPPNPAIWCIQATDFTWSMGVLKNLTELWLESHPQPPKIALMSWNSPTFLPSVPSIKAWAKDNNIEIVAEEVTPVPTLEFKTELARIKESGADILWFGMTPIWRPVRDMGEMGLLPGLELTKDGEYIWHEGGITPCSSQAGVTSTAIGTAGPWAKYAFTQNQEASYYEDETKAPALKAMNDAQRKTYGKVLTARHMHYHYGWVTAQITIAAWKRTLEKVGWENFSSKAICEQGLPDLTVDDPGLTGGISYADYPGDRQALGKYKFAVWDEELQCRRSLTDWQEYDKYCYENGYYPGVPGTKVK